jgi:hypothetical protein
VVVWWYIGQNNAATRQDLDDVRRELRAQIDSVLMECDSLKSELRAVRANTDTLKAGQEVIFRTMKENQGKETSLWDLIWR